MDDKDREQSPLTSAFYRCHSKSTCEMHHPETWVFAHESVKHLAELVIQKCKAKGITHPFHYHSIKWSKFNDGFPNLFIENVKDMVNNDVIFIASFHTPEVIFEQLSVLYAFPRYLARSLTIVLSYFPTGTMERVDYEGQIATAKTLASLLSHTPLTSRGPAHILVFDIHALQERFYFSDQVIPRLESAVPLLLQVIKSETHSVAFPDEGAYKRFHSMFANFEVIVCTKRREGDKRIVSIKEGNVTAKEIVIVDDLTQTGGTLRECASLLLKVGATAVSAYVTHAVFPQDSWRRFTHEQGEIRLKNFWITDSLPHAVEIAKHPPFTLLSLSDILPDILLRFDIR